MSSLPEDFFRSVLEQTHLSVIVTDPAQRIVWANPTFLAETSRRLDEVLGRFPSDFVRLDMTKEELAPINTRLGAGLPVQALLRLHAPDGGVWWSRMHVSPLHDASGSVRYLIGVHDNISEMHRDHERLAAQAATDFLTGLHNRRSFDGDLGRLLAAREALGGGPFTLVLLDLDGFKQVNDRHGHPMGDAVLRLVGRVLGGACRQSDRAYRLGGDEFALLLEAGAEGAGQAADRMVDEIQRTVQGELGLEVRTSGGGATWPDDGPDAHGLYRRADARLYTAKHGDSADPSAATAPD